MRSNFPPVNAGWLVNRASRYKLLHLLAATILILDQVTKLWIYFTVEFETESIAVIPGFFNIVHWGNTGAAWGIFQGMSFWLALLAVVALFAIFRLRHHLGLRSTPGQVGFGLLCGGIIGNLVDRVAHGYVIDFLDFRFGEFAWPAFNVADGAICIGVAIYLFYSFFQPEKLESTHH